MVPSLLSNGYSPLIDDDSVEKVVNISSHIGMCYAGMTPDYRLIVRRARKKAQQYYQVYKEAQPVGQLVGEVASIMQEFTQVHWQAPVLI